MTFSAGHQKIPGSGRKVGHSNNAAIRLRNAIFQACENYEKRDANGNVIASGLLPYIEMLRDSEPTLFCQMLTRLLPSAQSLEILLKTEVAAAEIDEMGQVIDAKISAHQLEREQLLQDLRDPSVIAQLVSDGDDE